MNSTASPAQPAIIDLRRGEPANAPRYYTVAILRLVSKKAVRHG